MKSEMVLFVLLKVEIDPDGACEVRQTGEKSKSLFDRGHLTTCAALIDSSDCLPIYGWDVKLYVHES